MGWEVGFMGWGVRDGRFWREVFCSRLLESKFRSFRRVGERMRGKSDRIVRRYFREREGSWLGSKKMTCNESEESMTLPDIDIKRGARGSQRFL